MPHKLEPEFDLDHYPPFPHDLPTVQFETISLTRLFHEDADEERRLLQACTGQGFFFLELGGSQDGDIILNGANELAHLAERTYALPLREKLKYMPTPGHLFGYGHAWRYRQREIDADIEEREETPNLAEFFNISKNDMILDDSEKMSRAWPSTVMEARPLLQDYVKSSHAVCMLILRALSKQVGIDPQDMMDQHRIGESSGDHVRLIRGQPRKKTDTSEIATTSHTDFGSITLLMNWLGGLQLWSEPNHEVGQRDPEGEGQWLWVKPQPGCAIMNLGDAAVKFSNGFLASGRHRVVPAPGEQGKWPRYSIVYFVRPEDKCIMRVMKGAPGEKDAVKNDECEGVTAQRWIVERAKGLGTKSNY